MNPQEIAVSIEVKPTGEAMVWAFDFLSLSGQGINERDALRDLQRTLEWGSGWLRAHGETPPAIDTPFNIVERQEATGYPEIGDTEGCFEWDLEPIDVAFVEQIKRYLIWSRQDVMALARAWQEESEGDPMISWEMTHLARAELYYASRLRGSPGDLMRPEWSEDRWGDIEWSRRFFLEQHIPYVLSMPDSARVYAVEGERWTARKTLRRALWHDLYHLRRLQTRLKAD